MAEVLNKFGEMKIEVFDTEDRGKVRILVGETDDEFKMLMMAAEFLTHLVAQKSNAGYEKALDLIRKGAMTYKMTKRNDLLEEYNNEKNKN